MEVSHSGQLHTLGKREPSGFEGSNPSTSATKYLTDNMKKAMKIYVLGSTSFMHEMVHTKNNLIDLGFDGWIHPDYEAFVRGEKQSILDKAKTEHAAVKRENNYLKVHYKHILESNAILIVNNEKNGIENYIGGNVLIEMGQAYVNNKIIFLLNSIPTNLPYVAEIECMDPICLYGDLNNINYG